MNPRTLTPSQRRETLRASLDAMLADRGNRARLARASDAVDFLEFAKTAPLVASHRSVSLFAYLALEFLGIHGDDNRLFLDQLVPGLPMHEAARATASSVALVTSDDHITFVGEKARLATTKEDMGGKHANLPRVSGTATAFLVTSRHIVTAGHVVAACNFSDLCFAFGYRSTTPLSDDGTYYELDRTHIIRPKQLLSLVNDSRLGDAAVLELYEPVPTSIARPVRLAPRDSVRSMHEVAMPTHARGQPLSIVARKPADDHVWSYPSILDHDDRYLYTNLDTFQGSSGSPVIDARGRVVGLQAQGTQDQSDNGQPVIYSEDNPGSWATRLGAIADVLAAIGAPLPPA
jgi:hypothetical protein